MILRSERIAQLIRKGKGVRSKDPLIITPSPDITELESSGSTSIDLRLGTWFMNLLPARMDSLKVGEKKSIERQLTKSHFVPFGKKYYLHPRNFVLGITLEWIRLPANLAGYVVGKSSWGRRGLIIATAFGVHPGFKGCLTLELSNVGEIPIELQPGIKVCQLCLHHVDGNKKNLVDRSGFAGRRRPILGVIKTDMFADCLALPTIPNLTSK